MVRRNPVAEFEPPIDRPALLWERPGQPVVEYGIWPERPMTIGRDATNSIVLESPFVSKVHAIFQYAGGQYAVEDLQSANGTKVNGAQVAVSVVRPGDVIEIGDQRLVFVDRSSQSGGQGSAALGKNAKLALAAIATVVTLVLPMMLLVRSGQPQSQALAPPITSSRAAAAATQSTPSAPQPAATLIDEIVRRAERTGVKPVDALLDEATIQYRVGRLREAVAIYTAVSAREPANELARGRLSAAQSELGRAIERHGSEAERAFAQLRFDDALLEWEKVLSLTDPSEPRYQQAQSGMERARSRRGR